MKMPSTRTAWTDAFGRRHTYLRLSLVEQCNLRCRYCMPSGGLQWTPESRLLSDDELVRLARLFAAGGVTKIRLTGGEPLLRPNVESLVASIREIDGIETVALTTNGLLLGKKLHSLLEAGVSRINVSLDTLRPDRFEAITRRPGYDLVRTAIRDAIDAGFTPLPVNCVVMRGVNDDELLDFVAWTEDVPVEVRFIEFMPFGGNEWSADRLVPLDEMKARVESNYVLEPVGDGPHATARTFRIPGHAGRVGFIASMTAPFCSGCNRLRVTADGRLKVCLFGDATLSLRDALRDGASDDDLRAHVQAALDGKHARHAGMNALASNPTDPMITIGG